MIPPNFLAKALWHEKHFSAPSSSLSKTKVSGRFSYPSSCFLSLWFLGYPLSFMLIVWPRDEAPMTNIELLPWFDGLLVSLNCANISCFLSDVPCFCTFFRSCKFPLACLFIFKPPVAPETNWAALSDRLRRMSESSAAFYFWDSLRLICSSNDWGGLVVPSWFETSCRLVLIISMQI